MNKCPDNDDDDEEAHSRSPTCFFTTPCISDADTEELTIPLSDVPCPDFQFPEYVGYQGIFLWIPDYLMKEGLISR